MSSRRAIWTHIGSPKLDTGCVGSIEGTDDSGDVDGMVVGKSELLELGKIEGSTESTEMGPELGMLEGVTDGRDEGPKLGGVELELGNDVVLSEGADDGSASGVMSGLEIEKLFFLHSD